MNFIFNENVDLLFMSESWEGEYSTLGDIINLDGYEVISNVHQRKGCGGRPAVIVKKEK